MSAASEVDLDSLVAQAATGSEAGVTGLYHALQPALVRFLAGLVGGDAEDLAAETWIDVAQCLHTFDGGGTDLRRLLFTIARRRAIDHGRKQWRRRTDPFGLRVPEATGGPDLADVVADLAASRRAVQRVSAVLPRPQAEVVLLRVVAGLSLDDVARVVGRSTNAVSTLQTRGLQRLAARLEDADALTRESRSRQNAARFRGPRAMT